MDLRFQVALVIFISCFDILLAVWQVHRNFPTAMLGLSDSEEDIPSAAYYASGGNKFLTHLLKVQKKPPKLVGSPGWADSWRCCGNEWAINDQEVRPLCVLVPTLPPFYGYRKLEDIKPVTEYIKDDLQYDFRTKTHSIR